MRIDKTNKNVLEKLDRSLKNCFPIGKKDDPKRIDFMGLDIPSDIPYSKFEFIEAIRNKEDYTIPITGRFMYRGKEHKVEMLNYPIISPDTGEAVMGGNAYSSVNLLKSRKGVYYRKVNDNLLETTFSVGGGKNFKAIFEPSSKKIHFRVYTTNYAAIPIMKRLGISENKMKLLLGEEIYEANSKSTLTKEGNLDRFLEAIQVERNEGETPEETLSKLRLDPKSTEIVLGNGATALSPTVLVNAVAKLIDMYKGEFNPPAKESTVFKEVKTSEDFIARRFYEESGKLRRQLRQNKDKYEDINDIVDKGLFNKVMGGYWNSSSASDLGVRMNPLAIDSMKEKVTIIAGDMGGISDDTLVTEEAKMMQPDSIGFIGPLQTPESSRTGITLHLAHGVEVKNGMMYQKFINVKTKKVEELSHYDAFFKKIGFPEIWDKANKKIRTKDDTVPVMYRNEIVEVKPSDVEYVLESNERAFSRSTSLIPGLDQTNGNRVQMGSKQMVQALSLKNPEKPIFYTDMNREVGQNMNIIAENHGYVHIKGNIILVDTTKYEVPNVSRIGQDSVLKYKIKVQDGQRVKKGDILAETNFHTDGELTMGRNVNMAYLPYKGNIEDGIIVSESLSKDFTSIHSKEFEIITGDEVEVNKDKYRNLFPLNITADNYDKLDKDGVIKKGSQVREGDVLVAAVREKIPSEEEVVLARLGKQMGAHLKDGALIYDKKVPAEVISVINNGSKVIVVVEYEKELEKGDKLTGFYGNKGIVTKILPDDQMPKRKNGERIDILFNPIGIPSRINPSQLISLAMGKKKGRTKANNFSEKRLTEAKEIGTKETIIHPEFGEIEGVPVGKNYFFKLMHVIDKKQSSRSNESYTSDMQPTKGKGVGGQSLDHGALYGLIAHGVDSFIEEAETLKSEYNPDLWTAIAEGRTLPVPKETFVYGKFNSILNSMGIDTEKVGPAVNYYPMTDERIDEMAGYEIKKPLMLKAKDYQPERGGLFAYELGGTKGEKWGKVTLNTPVINPLFEKNIAVLTDKKLSEVKDMKKGELYDQLKAIDVDKRIKEINNLKSNGIGKTSRDKLNKELKLLYGLKKAGVGAESYMMKKLPVLPPIYRNVTVDKEKNLVMAHSFNELYRDLIEANNLIGEKDKTTKTDEKRLQKYVDNLYKGKTNDQNKEFKGLMNYISGSSPKRGFYQSKVVKKRQDYSGRSTIIPNMDLAPGDVKVPYNMAVKVFEPWVFKEMRTRGFKRDEIEEMVKRKDEKVIGALNTVMEDRRVAINRAPSLHKFSIMGAKPKLTMGKALEIHPLYLSGFNADFDGDQMGVHVALSKEATKDIDDRMMLNKNIYNDMYQKRVMPEIMHEQIAGLFAATRSIDESKDPIKFANIEEVRRRFEENRLKYKPDTPIIIAMENGGKKISFGRALVNSYFPRQFRYWKGPIGKKELKRILGNFGHMIKPGEMAEIMNDLKDIGQWHATKYPISPGVEDLIDLKKEKENIVREAKRDARSLPKEKRQRKLLELSDNVTNRVMDKVKDTNAFVLLSRSGAKGNEAQTKQILGMPGYVLQGDGSVSDKMIVNSFGEGLSLPEMLYSMPGVRMGIIGRASSTAKPGAIAKTLVNGSFDQYISEDDCNTMKGITLKVTDMEAVHRLTVKPIKGYPKNTIITEAVLQDMERKGIKTIEVRSPETCKAREGICSKCWGVDNYGKFKEKGFQVGIAAAQAVSEPLTQSVMNAFHTGGLARMSDLDKNNNSDIPTGFERIKDTFLMPQHRHGQGVMSKVNGRIKEIKKNTTGEQVIVVEDDRRKLHEYTVPFGKQISVKKSDRVSKGDMLTHGLKNIHDLKDVSKDIYSFRNNLTNEIMESYEGTASQSRRAFEVMTRAITNVAEVKNDGGNIGVIEGDLMSLDELDSINSTGMRKMQVSNLLVGEILAEAVPKLNLKKGHKIVDKDVMDMKFRGIANVMVKASKIKYEPVLKGINTLPRAKYNDPLTRMNYNHINDTLSDMASYGMQSDFDTHVAIPRVVKGVGFKKK